LFGGLNEPDNYNGGVGGDHQTFALDLSGLPEMSAINPPSATPSKNPFVPTAEQLFQRRSAQLLDKLSSHESTTLTLSEILQRVTLDESERHAPPKDLAVKRFIDLLFLNGAGAVQLTQHAPFSEIEVTL
jgi:hypothetical protein